MDYGFYNPYLLNKLDRKGASIYVTWVVQKNIV